MEVNFSDVYFILIKDLFLKNKENLKCEIDSKKKEIIIFENSSFNNNGISTEKKYNEKNKEAFIKWKQSKCLMEKKIFICSRIYPDLKLALEKRNWVENPDQESTFFDLKWSLRKLDIDFNTLNSNQIVNHFNGNTKITRKADLCKNLRNLIWFRNVEMYSFFPRCYDLSEANDLDEFIEDFKINKVILNYKKAECIIKEYVNNPETIISLEQLIISYNIIERKFKDINIVIDEPGNKIY